LKKSAIPLSTQLQTFAWQWWEPKSRRKTTSSPTAGIGPIADRLLIYIHRWQADIEPLYIALAASVPTSISPKYADFRAFKSNSTFPKANRPLPKTACPEAKIIARTFHRCYRPLMFRILALVLLVSALVAPRAVWGAHLSGHDDLSAAGAAHSHHGEHTHEHDGDTLSVDELSETAGGEQDGLTHDHTPSFAIGGAIVLPDEAVLPTLAVTAASNVAVERLGASLSRPESLLRPPRFA